MKMLRKCRVVLRVLSSSFSTRAERLSELAPNNETKLLKVAIIGVPNAGKSTFINSLMDRKVCPTSSKVHTTRAKAMAIFTEGDSQIVFLDTPGLVNVSERKKYNLERSFAKDGKSSLTEADLIGVVHDASNVWTRERLDIKTIHLLEEFNQKPSFLVFNKVDVLKSKRKLLDLTRLVTENCIAGKPIPGTVRTKHNEQRGWPNFQEIFMVSALTGSGIEDVRNYLIKKAQLAKWMFPLKIWSDRTAEELVVDSVKAKLLDYLPQEIPYQLKPELEFFNINDEGSIATVVLVNCPTEKLARLVAGVGDGKLRQINESVQNDLQDTFQNYVRIKLVLNVPCLKK